MPRSLPPRPDVRTIDPNGPPVIDTVQAVTGGASPYCRRCGEWTAVRPHALAGLLDHVPDHECGTGVDAQAHAITGALASPFD